MAKRSLRPQLNQIRAWVHQGRTDAWIAHQLEISAAELREFRRQHDLSPEEGDDSAEVDLRDEIEAEVEAATAEQQAEEAEREKADAEKADAEKAKAGEPETAEEPEAEGGEGDEAAGDDAGSTDGEGADSADGDGAEGRPRRRRRRGRRGGRGRRKTEIEASFDHGEVDGYGLWLDPAVKDDATYAEHWAGHRDVTVKIEADQIVIRRAGEDDEG